MKDIIITVGKIALFVAFFAGLGLFIRHENERSQNLKYRRQIFQEAQMFGEHRLIRLETANENNLNVSGSFFLGIGDLTTDHSPEINIYFRWESEENTYYSSAIPASKIIWKAEEDHFDPTVEFYFNENYLDEMPNDYQEANGENLNFYFSRSWFKYAVVRATKETLEKEQLYIFKGK